MDEATTRALEPGRMHIAWDKMKWYASLPSDKPKSTIGRDGKLTRYLQKKIYKESESGLYSLKQIADRNGVSKFAVRTYQSPNAKFIRLYGE